MELFLSKLLPQLIYPLSLFIWLAIAGGVLAWLGRRRLGVALLSVAVAVLWVASTPVFSGSIRAGLERSYLPVPVSESPVADAIVVLGGAVSGPAYPRVDLELGGGANRVLHAARLYRADMKDILNAKIKRRESFRPFAPSILREAVSDWFETDDDVPFMMKVFRIKKERRQQIPAVTHVDGSGRLQTVSRNTNPLYYRLIETFRELTGIPMVLNTSFNENEPIVCRPEEALDCFLRTEMDMLVLGNYVVNRH